MKKVGLLTLLMPVAAFAQVPSSPSLGIAEGRCRPGESGPSLIVNLVGLKDRAGNLKAELYPANDSDFLADDNILLNAGKTFRRVVIDVPPTGAVQLCIRAPAAGTYGLTVLHDRDKDRKFNLSRSTGTASALGPIRRAKARSSRKLRSRASRSAVSRRPSMSSCCTGPGCCRSVASREIELA